MFKIKTLNKIAVCGTRELPQDKFTVSDEVENPDGILLRSYEMKESDLNDNLQVIARAGAGVNNIPVSLCTEKGIVVLNTPGANANAVKEMVIAGLLLSSRKVVDGINWAQGLAGQEDVAGLVEKGKSAFAGPEISGKKLGVFGLGAIGILVANIGRRLGMSVTGYDPYITIENAWSLSGGVHRAANEEALAADCDYLTVHIPANKETKHKFDANFFAKCKKGIRILNFSRAALFDNDALKAAIADGTVACYVTDFPTEDLLGIDGIIPIPHLGASTPESEDNCASMSAQEIREYLLYGNIKNSVNFPDCELLYTGKQRICIIHKNIPKIMGKMTNAVSEKGLNIDQMKNASKGDNAYTIIDVDEGSISGIEETLAALEGVVKVRVI